VGRFDVGEAGSLGVLVLLEMGRRGVVRVEDDVEVVDWAGSRCALHGVVILIIAITILAGHLGGLQFPHSWRVEDHILCDESPASFRLWPFASAGRRMQKVVYVALWA
jgi:hypothetical protein